MTIKPHRGKLGTTDAPTSTGARRPPRSQARAVMHVLIRAYQLTFSGLVGRQCRHLPTCSEYMDEAVQRHGTWPGAWMGLARLCRCGPGGTSGIDLVPDALPASAAWYKPWRFGRWRGVNAPPAACEAGGPDGGQRLRQ